jgi:hypothetical protein
MDKECFLPTRLALDKVAALNFSFDRVTKKIVLLAGFRKNCLVDNGALSNTLNHSIT